MNEQIKKLAEQAWLPIADYYVQAVIGPRDIQKFAELIVRECAEVCHKLAEDSDSYVVHDGDTCAEQIKQHFGIEE